MRTGRLPLGPDLQVPKGSEIQSSASAEKTTIEGPAAPATPHAPPGGPGPTHAGGGDSSLSDALRPATCRKGCLHPGHPARTRARGPAGSDLGGTIQPGKNSEPASHGGARARTPRLPGRFRRT